MSYKKTYQVKAIWKTLQGEGAFAGRPAVFVRFVGCNIWTGEDKDRLRDAERTGASCPLWCDTEFTKKGSSRLTASELIEEMNRVAGAIRFCVLTGGEPFLQADAPLIRALHEAGFWVAVETNGTVALAEAFTHPIDQTLSPPDWIVCSPKLPASALKIEYSDELKLVVPDYSLCDYLAFSAKVRTHLYQGHPSRYLWLQPEDGARKQEATSQAIGTALAHPDWRVSVQIHKILDVE